MGLMGRLRALPAPQELLCPSEGLGLWGECPELCSTLQQVLLWGQPRLGCCAGWAGELAGEMGRAGEGLG